MSDLIQVFEHQTLKVLSNPYDENGVRVGLTEGEFHHLLRYHSKVSDQYFSPSLNKIKFNQYVGVIQVGNTVIEILPKAGKEGGKEAWSNALYKMIKIAKNFRSKRGAQANLKFKKDRILELYFTEYLNELSSVLHIGLKKKYQFTEGNLRTVKGKINFTKDCFQNHSDKSRVYCKYQTFDFNHKLNKVLLYALNLVENLSHSRETIVEAKSFQLLFPETLDSKLNLATIDTITLDRTTYYYEKAFVLAKMIIKNHSPNLKSDNNSVISFLFDMNHLFEEFVYRTLRTKLKGYAVYRKQQKYWKNKKLIPDILVRSQEDNKVYVMDTKWKVPKNSSPDDADLRQVFTYNEYFEASKGALLYPNTGSFVGSTGKFKEKEHGCDILGIKLFDGNQGLCQESLVKSLESFFED